MGHVARLSTAKLTFTPQDGAPIELGYQQNVSISRSSEKKELLSNDRNIEEVVEDIETKVTYTLKTEIADLSLDILALAFKGSVKQVTYKAGDEFINGKIIKDKGTLEIGDVFLKQEKLYIVKEQVEHTSFKEDTHALNPKGYDKNLSIISPESRANNYGSLEIKGKNLVNGKEQICFIPKINLSFDGDLGISTNDYAKVSFEGKIAKVSGKELFSFLDI